MKPIGKGDCLIMQMLCRLARPIGTSQSFGYMNEFGWAILGALIFSFCLETIAKWLNMSAVKAEIPASIANLYDETAYVKSQTYLHKNTQLSIFQSGLGLLAMLLFWFMDGFGWLDHVTRSLGWGEVVTGLLFVGALALFNGLLGLPFAWYNTFVVEEQFGFNKTTAATFWLDRIKGVALGLIIGTPVLALILWLLGGMGPSAWLYVWLTMTALSLILQYIAPTWIMPLFNTFEPLSDDHPLKTSVLSYAEKVKFPLANMMVMDGSRRSSKANAFFTGFGKNRRIALFDTLIADHTVPELTAIVAHEVGHYKLRHLTKNMITGFLEVGAYLYIMSLCLNLAPLYTTFGIAQISVHAGLVFFAMLFSPIQLVLGLLGNYVSRKHEFEADAFALETAPEPQALGEALKKMSVKHLSNLFPHPLFVFLNYSHPPLLQRLAAMDRVIKPKP